MNLHVRTYMYMNNTCIYTCIMKVLKYCKKSEISKKVYTHNITCFGCYNVRAVTLYHFTEYVFYMYIFMYVCMYVCMYIFMAVLYFLKLNGFVDRYFESPTTLLEGQFLKQIHHIVSAVSNYTLILYWYECMWLHL